MKDRQKIKDEVIEEMVDWIKKNPPPAPYVGWALWGEETQTFDDIAWNINRLIMQRAVLIAISKTASAIFEDIRAKMMPRLSDTLSYDDYQELRKKWVGPLPDVQSMP